MDKPDSQKISENPTTIPAWILYAPLVVTFALICAASFLPDKRLWGINHLAFYPTAVRIVALALVAVAFHPRVGTAIHRWVEKGLAALRARDRLTAWLVILIAVFATYMFFEFKSATRLLGDSQLVENDIYQVFPEDTTDVGRVLEGLTDAPNHTLGILIAHYLSAVVASRVFDADPIRGLEWLSCLLGGLLVFIVLHLNRRGVLSSRVCVWLVILVLTSGAVELFFGYVEEYAPSFLVGVAYTLSAFAFLHKKGPWWAPCAAVALSTFLHVQGLLLIPSLAFLMWRGWTRHRGKTTPRYAMAVILVLVAAGTYVGGVHTPLRKFFMPLVGTDETVGVLSAAHWADIANELLLLCPAFLLVLSIGAWSVWRRPAQPEEPTPGPFTRRVEWEFATTLVVPCLLFLIFFNPVIGMYRDWDLFAVTLLGLIPLSLLTLNGVTGQVGVERAAGTALAIGCVLTISWVGINASAVMSPKRFATILEYDRSRAGYAYETLSLFYQNENRLPQAIDAMEKSRAVVANPRRMIRLSFLYRQIGDISSSITVLEEILKKNPSYPGARSNLLPALFLDEQYDKTAEVSRVGIELHPERPIYYYFLGKALIHLGREAEGKEALLQSKLRGLAPKLSEDADEELRVLEQKGE